LQSDSGSLVFFLPDTPVAVIVPHLNICMSHGSKTTVSYPLSSHLSRYVTYRLLYLRVSPRTLEIKTWVHFSDRHHSFYLATNRR
jgi:hypothetical protein